ncbi:MAG: ABC transporter permease [Bacilli bacterium]|nr:ABC transporter permease [Bacilli bacterium]
MTVFKTFLQVLNKYKATVIMYTVMLVAFEGLNFQTSDSNINFTASKPDVLIINEGEEIGITKAFIDYLDERTNIKDIKKDEESINDALFYRDVNYIVYIKPNFRDSILDNSPNASEQFEQYISSADRTIIEIKTTGDYQASIADMLVKKYINLADVYSRTYEDEEEIIKHINETLSLEIDTELTSKVDTNTLSRVTFYYNFLSYSVLAGCVYVICLILSSFKNKEINKRTIISSMDYKKFNMKLLLSNCLFAIVLWLIYVILGFVLVGSVPNDYLVIYLINSFIFTICSVTIAFLISNLINNKNAINGIVNVVALGSSFLCGAFVPMEWLPDSVLTIAHILPSYWYIKTNELLKGIEVFNSTSLEPIITNMLVLIVFIIIFIILTNIVTKLKLKK